MTPAGGKSDIYLVPRGLGKTFKVSLHEGGAWQVGLTSDFKHELVDEGRWTGGSRLMAEFAPPTEIGPGCLLAFRVLVPAGSVSIDSAGETLPKDLVWIPPPPSDRGVEIALVITADGVKIGGWPGRSSMGTALVGDFTLDSGHHVWLVHRHEAMPVLPETRGSVSRFEPAPEFSQPLEDCRALVLVNHDGRPAALMECRIEDKRFGAKGSS